ncbi:hypothetical protein J4221_01350 [Candidatus Pacearchaeota archaeon]|nr:hypothetical protein [Candidatus Pacearchaeota archaeon]
MVKKESKKENEEKILRNLKIPSKVIQFSPKKEKEDTEVDTEIELDEIGDESFVRIRRKTLEEIFPGLTEREVDNLEREIPVTREMRRDTDNDFRDYASTDKMNKNNKDYFSPSDYSESQQYHTTTTDTQTQFIEGERAGDNLRRNLPFVNETEFNRGFTTRDYEPKNKKKNW